MESPRPWRRALAAAFPHTIPILTGYGFLGFTYGVYANVAGFPFWYPALTAAVVYGGSLEFVTVELLLSPFAPLATFFMALMIQARHLFYGLTMLDKYKGLGWKKPYLIYAMSDETFSLTCSADPPEGVDRGWFYFFITLLDQLYWIAAALLGGLAGSLLPFDTQGLDFVMTAMFVVILLNQLLKEEKHISALAGAVSAIACRLIFGADNFLLPTMACILILLTVLRKTVESPVKRGGSV